MVPCPLFPVPRVRFFPLGPVLGLFSPVLDSKSRFIYWESRLAKRIRQCRGYLSRHGLQLSYLDKKSECIRIYNADPTAATQERLAGVLSVSPSIVREWLSRTKKDLNAERDTITCRYSRKMLRSSAGVEGTSWRS